MKYRIITLIGLAGSTLAVCFGGQDKFLQTLLLFMAIDWFTAVSYTHLAGNSILYKSADKTSARVQEGIDAGVCAALVKTVYGTDGNKWYYMGLQIDGNRFFGYIDVYKRQTEYVLHPKDS